MKDDPSFRQRQDCTPLQAADMIAFETRKQAIRHVEGSTIGGEIKSY